MKKRNIVIILLLVVVAGGLFYSVRQARKTNASEPVTKSSAVVAKTGTGTTTAAPAPVNHCAGNTSGKLVIVSTAEKHMWACDATQQVYETSVITGYNGLPEDVTPPGTYHVYAKTTDQTLRGSDSKGSWNDFVHYWEPFLDNKYGTYGFHDATWRAASDFGTIGPDSPNASHGCVEMDLVAMTWLYNWSTVGTTLTVS